MYMMRNSRCMYVCVFMFRFTGRWMERGWSNILIGSTATPESIHLVRSTRQRAFSCPSLTTMWKCVTGLSASAGSKVIRLFSHAIRYHQHLIYDLSSTLFRGICQDYHIT